MIFMDIHVGGKIPDELNNTDATPFPSTGERNSLTMMLLWPFKDMCKKLIKDNNEILLSRKTYAFNTAPKIL